MSEGRRVVTRSKTGSLVPKQFADSVLPTVSLKTALKASLAELEANDPGRMTRSRTAVNASFVVTSLPGFFRLGKSFLLLFRPFTGIITDWLEIAEIGFSWHCAIFDVQPTVLKQWRELRY